jgi:formate dehydrogenase subunit delta
MRRQDLIRMANQVAQFFDSYPEGAAEVAKHLRSFWDPRMRRQLQDYADQPDDDLHPLVRQAIERLPPVSHLQKEVGVR